MTAFLTDPRTMWVAGLMCVAWAVYWFDEAVKRRRMRKRGGSGTERAS